MKERKERVKKLKMNKKVIICLIGKAGSGKDTIVKQLVAHNHNWHSVVSCTTRPPRDYEQEGIDYNFLSAEDFTKKLLEGDLIEATFFNNWHYGTSKESLKNGVNIGVWNPEGYDCLKETTLYDNTIIVLPYYLQCDDKIRLLRQLQRENHPDVHEIIRRFSTDEEDFLTLENDDDIKILQNNTLEDLERNIECIMNDINQLGIFE